MTAASLAARGLHQCRLFFIALQFFTRVPIPRWVGFEPDWLHHASRYFPLVGVFVGAACAGVYAGAAWLWPAPLAAILATCAGVYLTGAFHEDGFADMCDGFGGGQTPARVLEIMKDSRIGAYGAIGIMLMLALKCAALATMAPVSACAALLLAHPLSRLAAASLIWRLDYARAEGKAKPMAQQMTGAELYIAGACVLVPAMLLGAGGLLSWGAIALASVSAAAAALWLGAMCVRRIQGYTGDCLGAVQQVAEVAIYLSVLACA